MLGHYTTPPTANESTIPDGRGQGIIPFVRLNDCGLGQRYQKFFDYLVLRHAIRHCVEVQNEPVPESWQGDIRDIFHGDIQAVLEQCPDLGAYNDGLRTPRTDPDLNVIADCAADGGRGDAARFGISPTTG